MIKKLLYIFILFIGIGIFPKYGYTTAYYVDETSGRSCAGAGTATTTAYCRLDQFTEAARTAGDIVFLRRNIATTTTRGDDLNFTSDGTIANPLIISADNDNLWNDASTTAQTYTVAVATSTLIASATITGVQAGDWFYIVGDCTQTYNSTSLNQCDFFYEVAWISGTQLGLYLPYKGNQTGAGNALVNMGKNPQWNVGAGDFQWNFDTDDFWLVKGMDIRSTDVNGIEIDSSYGHLFADTILITDRTTDGAITLQDDDFFLKLKKYRSESDRGFIAYVAVDVYGAITIQDSIATLGATATQYCIGSGGTASGAVMANIYVYDTVCRKGTGGDILEPVGTGGLLFARNLSLQSSTELGLATSPFTSLFFEDYDGIIGKNLQTNVGAGTNDNLSLLLSTTSASFIRSGGGATSIQVIPTTNTTSKWDFNKIKLFEYPIYTNTTSRQYDVYFVSTSTSAWSVDPTNTELWIECEYWAHDTNATSTRKIKKSTGTVDFNGSVTWQALSVTCQPSQTGILYLRGWYAKTKESSRMNEFFVDGKPVITP